MVEYKVLTQIKYYNSCSSYKTYGIIAFLDGVHIRTIPDISKDKVAIEKLVENFNKYDLELCHLSEAVEDFLYDLC